MVLDELLNRTRELASGCEVEPNMQKHSCTNKYLYPNECHYCAH